MLVVGWKFRKVSHSSSSDRQGQGWGQQNNNSTKSFVCGQGEGQWKGNMATNSHIRW